MPHSKSIRITAFSAVLLGATSVAGAAAGDTELVSVRLPGQKTALEDSRDSRISGNGRFVVFSSRSADLIAGDDNLHRDVFVHDLQTGTVERASVSSSGAQANGDSPDEPYAYSVGLSADGRFVVFSSAATNLVPGDTHGNDIFVRDRQAGQTERVDVGPAGVQSNSSSDNFPSISSSGRFVVFSSDATNLISAGDLNGFFDIYLRDRQTGQTELVSTSSNGALANNFSIQSSVSTDGRYVAFDSYASNLVAGDTNGVPDVFVRDRQTGQTQRVSVGAAGAQGNRGSSSPAISANGRYVTFASGASNLVAGDTNGVTDIFVRDLQTGQTIRVNLSSSGAQAAAGGPDSFIGSLDPSISADGRFVAFYSEAKNLVPGDTNDVPDFFVRDLQLSQTQRVSLSSSGVQQNKAPLMNTGSTTASVSDDGRYVAFGSNASNLVAADRNAALDVFVRDRQASTTSLVSESRVPSDAASGLSVVAAHGVSGDGRYVAFASNAPNLIADSFGVNNGDSQSEGVFLRDRLSDVTELVSLDSSGNPADGSSESAAVTPDGRFVAFYSNATNLTSPEASGFGDIYVRDREAGLTGRVSVSSAGAEGDFGADDDGVSISADGRYVAFSSSSSNLVANDTNRSQDVFVHDRQTGQTERVNPPLEGSQGDLDVINVAAAISADGRFVAFESNAPNLTSGSVQTFIHDRQSGQTMLVSAGLSGEFANAGGARAPSVSADGRFVAFQSTASNLVAGNANGYLQIFVRDRQTGRTERASVDAAGVQGNFASYGAAISADGRNVAFYSSAANLITGDRNQARDVFVHDRQTGATELMSSSPAGVQGNNTSSGAAISADGRLVAFNSLATNLATTDWNNLGDVYIHERAAGGTGTMTYTLTPSSRDFGSHPVNTSTARSFRLSNTGSAVLAISGVKIFGTHASSFSQTNNCGNALAIGGHCTIVVTFRAAVVGDKKAHLQVTAGGRVVTGLLIGRGTTAAP